MFIQDRTTIAFVNKLICSVRVRVRTGSALGPFHTGKFLSKVTFDCLQGGPKSLTNILESL